MRKIACLALFILLTTAAVPPPDIDSMIGRARDLSGQENYSGALEILKQAEAGAPENKLMIIYMELGVNCRKAKKYDDAVDRKSVV